MIGNKLVFKTPDEVESVYYEAFIHCDTEVMGALWADGDVVCIHPGSRAIAGYDAVMRSWKHIFTGARRPQVKFTLLNRTINDDISVHLVSEEIATGGDTAAVVLATNVYKKFDSGWLMIQHHASLVQTKELGYTLQ